VQMFMMLFVGLAARPSADDPRTQDYNRRWTEYMAELARSGALESGAPFEPDGRTVRSESVDPLELAEVDIGGYVLVRAESLDAAVRMAQGAPHIELGGTTLIRPCIAVGP
jgi:hypothetical protein